MTPEMYQQAKRIIEQSEELPEEIRDEHIERLCAGKAELLEYIRQQRSASASAGHTMPTRGFSSGTWEIPFLLGQYEINGLIGQGGMGQVFRAWDPNMARTVAIKTIRIGGNIHLTIKKEILLSEMKLGAKLDRIDGIVTFHHAAIDDESGVAYIVMEFVDGKSLQDTIQPGRALEQSMALDILKQAAIALDQAHARGVVHCDIKPGNILLHKGITVKITDFGISRFKEPGVTPETGPAQGLATPEYMSPEQALGQKVLDGRSDQYSLAVVAFQLLTGRLPFTGSALAVQQGILGFDRPSASAVNAALPSAIDELLKRGMARKGEERFDNCAQFVEALAGSLLHRQTAHAPSSGASDPFLTTPTHPKNLPKEEVAEKVVPGPGRPKRGRSILYGAIAVVAIAALATAAIRNFRDLLPWSKPAAPVATVPSVRNFVADPSRIKPGDSAVLRWDVKGADDVVIDHGIGKVRASGSFEVRPEAATTYTLNASSDAGGISANTHIGIVSGKITKDPGPPPVPIPVPLPVVARFVAEPDVIGPGEKATLSWEISGANGATIDPGVGKVDPAIKGSVEVKPAATTEYTLSATNSTGEVPARVTVKVRPASISSSNADTLLRDGKAQLARHEYQEGRDSLLKAAQAGNPEGMVLLGAMYSEGLGGPKDDPEAVRRFEQAASAGNVRGMYNLGHMYSNGWEGHRKNDSEAANWYAKAVRGGSTDAAYRLGMMYEQGKGVPKDPDEARELYQTAGTPEARSRLSMLPKISAKPDLPERRPPSVLTLHSISPSPIQENRSRQYTLSGSGFSPESQVRLDVDGFVGSRMDSANNRPVEVESGGFWLKVYINVPYRQTQAPVHVIVRNPDGQEVRLEAPTQR